MTLPDDAGVLNRNGVLHMITHSGLLVPVSMPGPNDEPAFRVRHVRREDITWALSNLCRFNGHLDCFYSVAQHSVHVADRVFEETKDRRQALLGLLHDAHEAYTGDVVRPIKRAWHMLDYRMLCDHIKDCINAAFDLNGVTCDILERVDNEMIYHEATQLGNWITSDWNLPTPQWEIELFPFSPPQARDMFRGAFYRYGAL